MALQRLLLEKSFGEAKPESVCCFFSTVPSLPAFDYEPKPYNGPRADEVFQKRKKFLGPSLFHFYQKPLNIVERKMQSLFDENGRRYLVAFAGILTVSAGHCHPDVLNAIFEQSKLQNVIGNMFFIVAFGS